MKRINFLTLFFTLAALLIVGKLFFLQIIQGEKLSINAENQHFSALTIPAKRGEILTSDHYPLVTNQPAYLVYAALPEIKSDKKDISAKLAPIFVADDLKKELPMKSEASESASIDKQKERAQQLKKKEDEIYELLSLPKVVWVPLRKKISKETMTEIKDLDIAGLGFEEDEKRMYPQSSSSAQLLGFVASDSNGNDKGYFGLEGFYNGELRGKSGRLKEEIDAQGRPILVGSRVDVPPKDGRNLVLTIDRGMQFIIEDKLQNGVKKYGAKSGSIIVMNPKSGEVLATSSFPSYDPNNWDKYDRNLFRNPAINDVYEPGSTFKVITASGAIDSGVVTTETICPCSGPKRLGPFEIRTWNNKYYPNSTLPQILQHSDNVGSVFVQEKLGKDKFLDYVENFGFGKETKIDLEGESRGILRDRDQWEQIDLSTASFGQGHSVTMIQMVTAVSAIANGGELPQPQVVKEITDKESGKTVEIKPRMVRRVIKKETSSTITEMMVGAVENGEARYFVPKGYRIAGKTGTAQIPIEGRYDPNKTIASFIGFAPADDPKFVMLVRIDQPSTSPWGSETAAPLFFDIAKELFNYYGIAPNR